MKKIVSLLLVTFMLFFALLLAVSARTETSEHIFGEWSPFNTEICQTRYKRECSVCGTVQTAKDIVPTTVSFSMPAITANAGDTVLLSLYSVYFDNHSLVAASDIVWSSDDVQIKDNCFTPESAGVYRLTASAGSLTKTVYVVAKNLTDTEYVLYFDDFTSEGLDGYRPIEIPSGTEYYVSDGKLIMDATGNTANHMRILLPEWIGDFGDYRIDTSFTILSTMSDTYWFGVMARIQDEDFPYWQATIRRNAAAESGVEVATRTKKSGASSGWTVTHKTSFTEKLSASKYYTQTFDILGNTATHYVNGTSLLTSNAMTFSAGDVGFHVRASKASVDSIKIVLPVQDPIHVFSDWIVSESADCIRDGEEFRSCADCDKVETRVLKGGHDLVSHPAKLPTCTEPGYQAYEICSRCGYSTFATEIPALGHYFDRSVHSVAHRGYSSIAPENTLAAYRLAKEMGFVFVECDVSFTADGVPVLLHDNTIDRTSNGSGKVTALTYEQLLQYDFGSWKGAEYAGTKIPTFEEFIALCKELNLYPYIELKSNGNYTKNNVKNLVKIVEEYGMTENSTWISFNASYLGYVKIANDTARLGYLKNSDATQAVINTANGLRTAKNEVFLNLNYSVLTPSGVLLAASNGFAVEVWTVNDVAALQKLPTYVSGITSDILIANNVFTDVKVSPPTCSEEGYTTYTCLCGDSHVDDYIPATGEHNYENGVCSECGVPQPYPILIVTQPTPSAAVIGEVASVSVTAKGEGLTYQWYFRNTENGALSRSSITSSTYSTTVTKSNINRVLYCVITDAYGNQVKTETVKLIQPAGEALAIVTQPIPSSAVIGEVASVSVTAKGEGLTYQWYFRNSENGALSRSSITSSTYSTTVTKSNINRVLYCVITDAYGNQVKTETVKLIQPTGEALEIVTQPTPSSAVIGEVASVSVTAKGEGLTYQWYFRNTENGALCKSSITSNTYSTTVTKSNMNRVLYCVITDAYGNQVTTEVVTLIHEGADHAPENVYYTSLGAALDDDTMTGDATFATGAVEAYMDSKTGVKMLRLMGDIELTETVYASSHIVIDLNGHTIRITASHGILVGSGSVTIQGGNIELTAFGAGTAAKPSVVIQVRSGAKLTVCDATVTAIDNSNGSVVGIWGEADSELNLNRASVLVRAEKSLGNIGVYAQGTATLSDCTIIAESDYTGNAAGTAYASVSYGISSESDLTLLNCYVWGAHSGVKALGNVFVDGGTYEGYGHGGFYLSGPDTISYFYNAAFNWADMREGTFADNIAGTNNAAFYVGANNDITAYFDGCSFTSNNATKSYCLVLRSSGKETNNRVYVSNTSFKNYKKYAYRIGNSESAVDLYAYSGVGNVYSGRVFNYANKGFYTEETYA